MTLRLHSYTNYLLSVTSQSPTTQLGNDPDAKAMHKQVQAIQASLGINRHSQLDIKHRPATLGMTLATLPPILASPTSLGTSNGSRNHDDESFTARIVEGNKMTNERALQVRLNPFTHWMLLI